MITYRAGRPQPDNREQAQQGGEEEACMAVLNNFYGDGQSHNYSLFLLINTLYFRHQVA